MEKQATDFGLENFHLITITHLKGLGGRPLTGTQTLTGTPTPYWDVAQSQRMKVINSIAPSGDVPTRNAPKAASASHNLRRSLHGRVPKVEWLLC